MKTISLSALTLALALTFTSCESSGDLKTDLDSINFSAQPSATGGNSGDISRTNFNQGNATGTATGSGTSTGTGGGAGSGAGSTGSATGGGSTGGGR